ncbi:MAG: hypothetical protein K8R59_04390 [Thermoanaerobaculales bacterium]|nr:hypothetical protein [Thermoanaerobaculales bacterium]
MNYIAKWDGTSWSALSGPSGTGLNGTVKTLIVYDDGGGEGLFAGGYFTQAGGVTVNGIAKWDGSSWSALSGPAGVGVESITFDQLYVAALAVYDDGAGQALYAGGFFHIAGGITVNHIAKWDGSAWSALIGSSGTGVESSGSVKALVVYDDATGPALFVGGWFEFAGEILTRRIAKWNGSEWTALNGPSGAGMEHAVYSLAVHDDGAGERLYAGGRFVSAGGIEANFIAKWDGNVWSGLTGPADNGMIHTALESSIYQSVSALASFNDGSGPALFAGGDFTSAGGWPSSNIAKWACENLLFIDGFESGDTSRWEESIGEVP